MYRCVIIGSGLGGLSCGSILSKNGYEVTVLEQGTQIGGCLQCFRRGDAVFDTGMHYIGAGAPGQTLHTLLRYLDIASSVRLTPLDTRGYDVISFQGEHYSLANGKEHFVNAMAAFFPQRRDELCHYYDLVKQVAASSPLHSLSRDADLNVFADYQTQSVDRVIDRIISDPLLRQVLVGTLPLYAGEKGTTPFATHALIADSYDQSASRIVGGSATVANALADVIRSRGGQVLVGQQATQIVCDDTHATAVVTSNGERYEADLVISAIHPASTVKLVDSHLLRPAYRRRIASYRNTTSSFTVYLKFRKESVQYMNHNLYYYRTPTVWNCEHYDAQSWPKFLLYMHFCHEENPTYAETGEVLTDMGVDEVNQWLGTRVGRRGDDYEDFKRRKAERLLDALEEEVPGIRDHIETYYTSTPLTYLDYTGVPDGAMYGIAKDVNLVGMGSVSCRTSIPNLLLAGQCVTLHGMMGVLAGSLLTCAEVLTLDEVFAQLKCDE